MTLSCASLLYCSSTTYATNDRQASDVHVRPRPITQSTNRNRALVVKPKGEIPAPPIPRNRLLSEFKMLGAARKQKRKDHASPDRLARQSIGRPGVISFSAANMFSFSFILGEYSDTYIVTSPGSPRWQASHLNPLLGSSTTVPSKLIELEGRRGT